MQGSAHATDMGGDVNVNLFELQIWGGEASTSHILTDASSHTILKGKLK